MQRFKAFFAYAATLLSANTPPITMASLLMGLAAWGTQHVLETMIPGTGTAFRAVRVFTSIAVALGVLVGAARLLHIEEFKEALARAASRLGMS